MILTKDIVDINQKRFVKKLLNLILIGYNLTKLNVRQESGFTAYEAKLEIIYNKR